MGLLRNGPWVCGLLAALALPALADTDEQAAQAVLQSFGLVGTWAPDCAHPPSFNNPHETYTIPLSGPILIVTESTPGAPESTVKILNAQRLSDGSLSTELELEDHSHETIIAVLDKGKVRTWSSQRGGKSLVKDGLDVFHTATQWRQRCDR
jgi:hypothetical protein